MLYVTSFWPTGQYGFVAIASLFVAAAVIDIGMVNGIYVFVVSSVLGMLIVPDKASPLLFILFFGYYPIVKSLIEKIGNVFLQWILKLLVFNAALTVMWFLFREMLLGFSEGIPGILIVYILGNVIFVVYDYGYSKVIRFYAERVSRYTSGR